MRYGLSLVLAALLFSSVLAAAPKTPMRKGLKAAKQVICPVTGTKIDPAKAYAKTIYKGKTYYFCCAGCPEEFKKNPGKYSKSK